MQMTLSRILLLPFCVLTLMTTCSDIEDHREENADEIKTERLMVLWTSDNRDVALKMVFMYTTYAQTKAWWNDIRFIVWGPSAKLLANDSELQDGIAKMKEAGVELLACKACSDSYGVSEALAGLGIDVKYMGKPMTDMLQSGWTSLTF